MINIMLHLSKEKLTTVTSGDCLWLMIDMCLLTMLPRITDDNGLLSLLVIISEILSGIGFLILFFGKYRTDTNPLVGVVTVIWLLLLSLRAFHLITIPEFTVYIFFGMAVLSAVGFMALAIAEKKNTNQK